MLIGITGKKASGKSTVAEYLQKRYDYKEYAYATALKNACIEIFGLEKKQVFGSQADKEEIDPYWEISPRQMAQEVGTAIRNISSIKKIWIRNIERNILKDILRDRNCNIVISDVRYQDEADLITKYGGIIIDIRRYTEYIDLHESEQQIIVANHIIYNTTAKAKLLRQIDKIIQSK